MGIKNGVYAAIHAYIIVFCQNCMIITHLFSVFVPETKIVLIAKKDGIFDLSG